ncbi:MAG TPA: hypothetical protein DCS97_16205 [Planctomycetes bacterium]|nr:hypothetical protein [Planctomycetota bacterium]
MRDVPRILAALLLLTVGWAAEGDAYRRVMQAMQDHPHRQPGSVGWTAAAEAVEGALRDAGLEPMRMSYGTLVPRTRICRLTVDGTEVSGVLAMGPNGAIPPTTWGRPISGPALWLGDGTLEEMRGLPIAGCIALVRLGSPHLPQLFSQGAAAVITVGEQTTQWQVARMFTEAPVASPRAWLSRAAAEAHGLTSNPATLRQASLTIDVRWEDAETANIWAMIPADPDAPPERAAQTLVLAAELATSGAVPDSCPGGRQAANAALLAELAARIAAQPLGRNVLVCFLGSHYAGQDGAKLLYWVAAKANRGSRESDPLVDREGWTAGQIAANARRLEVLAADDVLTQAGDEAFWLRERMRRLLAGWVNDRNYVFRSLNLDLRAATVRGDTAQAERLKAEAATVKARIATINEMRRQVYERRITDAATFGELRAALHAEIESMHRWLSADLRNLAGWRKLETALAGRPILAHVGIDLARIDRPWLPNPFGADCMSVYASGASKPQVGFFVKHVDAWQQAWNRVEAQLPGAAPMRSPESSATFGYEFVSTPRQRQVGSIVPLGMGIMAAQLVTLGDALDLDELPVAGAPDLLPLASPLAAWMRELAAAELPQKTGMQVAPRYNDKLVYRYADGWTGLRVDQLAPGSEEVDGPAAGALVVVRNGYWAPSSADSAQLCGRSNGIITRVNPQGYVFAPNVIDDTTIARVNAVAFDETGAPRSWFAGNTATAAMAFNIRLWTGRGNGVYVPFTPAEYSLSTPYDLLVGRTDSAVKRKFAYSAPGGLFAVSNEERSLKLMGNGLFALNATAKRAQGHGLQPDAAGLLSLDLVRQSAVDIATLNQQRLQVLRDKNLISRPIERVHADCTDNLEQAASARAAGEIQRAVAHETAAAALAYRAHNPLRESANDLLRAVVILLILSIPFAFALERLVLGAVSIYRQILGFLGVFLATFAVLYLTHPAFALANAPLIIFLAFVIILLSAFVISVVMGKFKHELKALQGLSQKSHGAAAGDSTTLAAVIIGIAGMRNRPLKTFLTTATVTLLTFTILVFASFESGEAVVETYLGKGRGSDRIEVHQPSFLRVPERLAGAIEQLHGERYEVLRRSASFRNPLASEYERNINDVVVDPQTGRMLKLAALLGLDPREAPRLPAGLLDGLAEPAAGEPAPLLLSKASAARLRLTPGAELRIRGQAFRLTGIFDEELLKSVENIEGTRLLPPDFEETFAAAGNQNLGNTSAFNETVQALDVTSFIFSSPALTAITTNQAIRELGGMVNTLVLYPKPGADLGRAAGEIAGIFSGPIYATSGDGAKRYFYTREVTGSGYLDLIVPLLLGGLIIFSSLLGSIVDRQKEIFTYSALGLSPRDVGTLFFAESSVIAVVGGMGGYLLGQLASKLLTLLNDHGLVAVPDMNFSSMSSLVTILIVMAMVLLSTIYPALMASRSANPGVNRSWKMPKPDGDKLVFTFPFTVPEASFGGIVAFIREHFGNHSDAALDVFAAKQVGLFRVDGHRVGIRAEVALAPFDLGVYQRFSMRTRPSDIAGIDEVVVEIERINGTPSTWLRGNRAFIKDLREQFLIWRSLPADAVAHYQAESARVLAEVDRIPGGADGQS